MNRTGHKRERHGREKLGHWLEMGVMMWEGGVQLTGTAMLMERGCTIFLKSPWHR